MMKRELEAFIEQLNKQEFEDFYRNHPNKDVLIYYNLKEHDLNKILNRGSIKKPKKKLLLLIKEIDLNIAREYLNQYRF